MINFKYVMVYHPGLADERVLWVLNYKSLGKALEALERQNKACGDKSHDIARVNPDGSLVYEY